MNPLYTSLPAKAATGWRPWAILVALCLLMYGPGLASLPVTDRDEARFAQATRQMLESGDYLRIRFLDEARNNKPAGIYWLQAASVAALSNAESDAIWPYRLPSLAGAVGAVLLTFAFGSRWIGREAALAGAAILATTLGLDIEAHLAKTDAVLLCLTVAAQGALAEAWRVRGERVPARWAVLFWLAQGAAILVKGPVTPALSILTIAALSLAARDARWLRGLRPARGVALLVLAVAPWLIAISVATHGAFLEGSLLRDFFGKLAGGEESHGAWPGYYLLLVWATFWPGALVLAPAAALAWRTRREDVTLFLVAWALPFWIALELVPTKLPHYLLPVFPALALMAGRALTARELPRAAWRAGAVLFAVATFLMAALLLGAPLWLGMGLEPAGLVLALIALVFGAQIAYRAWRESDTVRARHLVLAALLVLPAAFAVEAPRLHPLWLSRSAANLVPPGVPVSVAGDSEPSLVFLLGTRTVLASPQEAAARLSSGGVALVESHDEKAFHAALEALGVRAEPAGQAAGLDYSNGKRIVLTLYRASGAR
jgi:4-amino-4-deoxy-L-arabinose transferase-like glycosyltransferase